MGSRLIRANLLLIVLRYIIGGETRVELRCKND